MKIINILFNYKKKVGPQKIAGVEKVFIDYTKLFIEDGHEVLSIFKSGAPYKQNVIDLGSKTREINAMGHGDIITMARLAWIFTIYKPDAIICHSGRALFMSYFGRFFRKIPIISVNHGIKVKKFMKSDYTFHVNTHFAQEMIKMGKKKHESLAIPNMLAVDDNFNESKDQKWHKPVTIGCLGIVDGNKRQIEVLKSMEILQKQGVDLKFIVAGDGSYLKRMKNLAKTLNLDKKVQFLGWISDKKTFFDDIDIFILPSWEETFGIVLLEAMLYKIPIITTNSTGPRDIIEHEVDGLVVDRENREQFPQLIADSIEKLIKNPELAKKMTENAYKKFHKKYTYKIVGDNIKKTVKNIVKTYKN